MRDELADLVHPVLERGLRLRERLAEGEGLSLEAEQSALLGLLRTEAEARRWPDYGGEAVGQDGQGAEPTRAVVGRGGAGRFLGVRYALVCWLDELFVLDSPWSEQWNEFKLEAALYASNDRAWKFHEQARLAAARGPAVLEPYLLCVMLGFRGDLGDDPERLAAWVSEARSTIHGGHPQGWVAPAALEPAARVPPLHGRRRLQRLILVAGAVLLAVLPVVAFFLVRQLAGRGS
jgi:type VI secretion system protein ImpK